jgi:MFS family permease
VGALLMALLSTRLPPWRRPGQALLVTVAGFGIATIGFGLSTSLWLSLLCLFFTGIFDELSVVIRLTLEQVITPDPLRGRVSSLHYVFIGFSNELGSFESGATAALFGPVASVAGGGLGTLAVVALVALLWPSLSRLGPLHTLKPME